MRRSDREIKDFNEIIKVLDSCDTIRIAMFDENFPYILPVSFGYTVCDDKLAVYFHGANEGKKIELLEKNNNVCIETDVCHCFTGDGCEASCDYESVIGYGKAKRVFNDEAVSALNAILSHCNFDNFPINQKLLDVTAVYKIEIEEITGKRRITT